MSLPKPIQVAAPAPPSRGVAFAYLAGLLGEHQARALLRSHFQGSELRASRAEAGCIDFLTLWRVLHANIEFTGDEGHKLAAVSVPRGNFELLVTSMLQGMHLADGMARLADGARILRPDLRFKVVGNRGRLHLTITSATTPSRAKEIYIEAIAVVIHCTIRWAMGYPVTPWRVRASEQLSGDDGSILYAIASTLRRGGEGVTLVYDQAAASAVFKPGDFRHRDEAIFEEYVRLVEPSVQHVGASQGLPSDKGLPQRVRTCILGGTPDQAAVARQLGLSVSTLRRRLSEQGISFREIQDQARRELAEVLFLGDKSLEDIAIELGLSDTRSLRRSCMAWFGQSPSNSRRAVRDLRSHDELI